MLFNKGVKGFTILRLFSCGQCESVFHNHVNISHISIALVKNCHISTTQLATGQSSTNYVGKK